MKSEYASDYTRIMSKVNLNDAELQSWKNTADNMYFPFSEEHGVFLQQDGFLDKELVKVSDLDPSQLIKNGVGIEFYVHHISNKPILYKVFTSSKKILPKNNWKNISIFTNHLLFMKVRFRLVCTRFKQQL